MLHELRVNDRARRLEWVALTDISPALVRTVVHAEDRHFYEHGGVDWRALAAVAVRVAGGDTSRGASTISMQLAARLDDAARANGRRGFIEKLSQVRLARAVESAWSKDEIMEAYLNLATFRGELQGVAAASRGLFDKHPSGLDMAESLTLAALLRSPNASQTAVAARACKLSEALGTGIDCDSLSQRVHILNGPLRVRQLANDGGSMAAR